VEVDEVAWLPLAEVAERLTYEDERRLIDRVPDELRQADERRRPSGLG